MKYLLILFSIPFLFSCEFSQNISAENTKYMPKTTDRKLKSSETGYLIQIDELTKTDMSGKADPDFNSDAKFFPIRAEGINTAWDPDLGIISLSSYEEESQGPGPYATSRILYLPSNYEKSLDEDYIYRVQVNTSNISAYDKLVGTAAELNFRSYDYNLTDATGNEKYVTVDVDEIGSNYISGRAFIPMKRIVYKQGIPTDIIKAITTVYFVACDGC